jgi:hypothetical protein
LTVFAGVRRSEDADALRAQGARIGPVMLDVTDAAAIVTAARQVGSTGAEVVAKAVAHALLAKRPRTRYTVGPGAGMMPLVRLLPDRLRDTLVLRSFGG